VLVISTQYSILIVAALVPRLERVICCAENAFLSPNERKSLPSVAAVSSQLCRFPPAKAVVEIIVKTEKWVS
jgi:hypothetical protein